MHCLNPELRGRGGGGRKGEGDGEGERPHHRHSGPACLGPPAAPTRQAAGLGAAQGAGAAGASPLLRFDMAVALKVVVVRAPGDPRGGTGYDLAAAAATTAAAAAATSRHRFFFHWMPGGRTCQPAGKGHRPHGRPPHWLRRRDSPSGALVGVGGRK